MILIIDYGMSNLRSVSKAMEKLGAAVKVSGDAKDIERADKVILPGVGAFGDAMAELEKRNLIEPLGKFAHSGKPFLGICLGLQLLFDSSEESPGIQGLGILPGKVIRFPRNRSLKVPHMGWNQIRIKKEGCPLLKEIKDSSFFYFVHSYYAQPQSPNVILAESDYGGSFTCMIWKSNLYGAQFHPEKSQESGLKTLSNFVKL